MGAFVRGGMATEQSVSDTRSQIALTNMRMLLNSAVATGALVSGKQWELLTDEWGASSANEAYSAPGSIGYYFSQESYSADKIPEMTSNVLPSGTASASSEYSSNYAAWKAFSSAGVGEWASNNATGWLAYDFGGGNGFVAGSYRLVASTAGNSVYAPKEWTFEGFDGAEWIVLDTRAAQPAWAQSESRIYTLTNSVAYSKYRVNITQSQTAGWQVLELFEIFEHQLALNMTLIPPAAANVSVSPAFVGVCFLWKDESGSAVLGTDITVELSRDNGATYTAATLENVTAYDGTYSVIKARADVSAQPAGTQLLCRIKTLNSKAQRIAAPAIYAE